jgi:hypothetical protein
LFHVFSFENDRNEYLKVSSLWVSTLNKIDKLILKLYKTFKSMKCHWQK